MPREKMFTVIEPILKCYCRLILQPRDFQNILCLSVSTSVTRNKYFRPPIKNIKPNTTPPEDSVQVENETSHIWEDRQLDGLLDKSFFLPGSGHQIFIIQPFIKWGRSKKRNTTPELQLLESETLIKTLRQWKVVDKVIISLQSYNSKYFFGKGNLQLIKDHIRKSPHISGVFISVNTLQLIQQVTLEEEFGVPVFDRYSIIINIFKEHAQTKEAKLQIQMAQLPYLWKILRGVNVGMADKVGIQGSYIGGDGLQLLSDRKEVFKRREGILKKQILELREKREIARSKREKTNIPVVAVVGYTNAGKTSLIKALTGKENLEPQDYLFATLDVTSHLGKLPSGLDVFFVDTLGFINDIPTYLIESFVLTLEDAISANVIIHVRDISHPDTVAQNDNVIQTLKDLNLSEESINNIITVGNKIDLVNKKDLINFQDMILVSSTRFTGIDILRKQVELKIFEVTDKFIIIIRVQSGGEEYNWLHENSTVTEETPDSKNNQFIFVKTIISPSTLNKFKHHFIKNYKTR